MNGMLYRRDQSRQDQSIDRVKGIDASFSSSWLDLSSIDPESCWNCSKGIHTLEDDRDDSVKVQEWAHEGRP